MTELSILDKEKTAADLVVGRHILGLVGPLNAVSLDIDRGFVFIEDNAVSLRNVVVGKRRLGTIDIALTSDGSYDITVAHYTKSGNEELYSWKGIAENDVRRYLSYLWTYSNRQLASV